MSPMPYPHIFGYLKGWWLKHSPEQPVPVLGNIFHEEIFPLILPGATWSCFLLSYSLWEDTDPYLATASFQGVLEND